MTNTVFRIESEGELAVPCPSLIVATWEPPSHPEARVATSAEGVVLAEAEPGHFCLTWRYTLAGRDVLRAVAA